METKAPKTLVGQVTKRMTADLSGAGAADTAGHMEGFRPCLSVPFTRLRPGARVPSAGSLDAAGYDLYACTDGPIEIPPRTCVPIGTGLALAIPAGFFGAIFARSGLASRQSLRPANCVGVCDSDYRGEYIVPLFNDSDSSRTVFPGDRIAQLVLLPCYHSIFEETDSLPETGRGNQGFGSTGR